MRIPIVDENDNFLYYKEENERDREKEITRSTGIWILNERAEILVAKRAENKTHYPNMWGPSAAGSLEEGDTYESNAIKEAEEEIGIKLSKFVPGPKCKEYDNHHFFAQYFFATIPNDTDITLQKEEVSEVRWVTLEELKDWYAKAPEEFLPTFKKSLEFIEEYAIKSKKTT